MARPLNHDASAWLKRALLLVIIGLVVQLFCTFDVTPGTFMIYAMLGITTIGLGLVAFVIAVVKARRGPSPEPAPEEAADGA